MEYTCFHCKKVFVDKYKKRKYCSLACTYTKMEGKNYWLGKKMNFSEEFRQELRERALTNIAKYPQGHWFGKKRPDLTGANHPAWNGGVNTTERRKDMQSMEYRFWRKSVFKRDNYTCVLCQATGYVEADHIKQYALYPELRYELSNGRTLCKPCHKKQPVQWRGLRKKDQALLTTL